MEQPSNLFLLSEPNLRASSRSFIQEFSVAQVSDHSLSTALICTADCKQSLFFFQLTRYVYGDQGVVDAWSIPYPIYFLPEYPNVWWHPDNDDSI